MNRERVAEKTIDKIWDTVNGSDADEKVYWKVLDIIEKYRNRIIAEEGKVIDEILKQAPLEVENNDEGSEIPQQPKLPEKEEIQKVIRETPLKHYEIIARQDVTGKYFLRGSAVRDIADQIIDYLKAREEK